MNAPISSEVYRDALARFASGVTVVTAAGPVGFTASAFSAVSLAPPLVLVCAAKRGATHDALVSADLFGVSVLSERQAWIAERCGRSGPDRFHGVPLRRSARVPLVDDALVQLECRRYGAHDAGDHTILLGEVVYAAVGAGGPLVHFGRALGGFKAKGGES